MAQAEEGSQQLKFPKQLTGSLAIAPIFCYCLQNAFQSVSITLLPCAWQRTKPFLDHYLKNPHSILAFGEVRIIGSHLGGSPTMILQPIWPDLKTAQGRKERRVTSRPCQGLSTHKFSAQGLTGSSLLLEAGEVGIAQRSPGKLGAELGCDRSLTGPLAP